MLALLSRRYVPAAALLATGIAAVVAIIGLAGAAHPPLQQLADEAALAGAAALGTSEAATEAERRAQAMVASNRVMAPATVRQAQTTVRDWAVTVKLATDDGQASSTARYVPPAQPTEWVWASRQRFAFKRAPVMVGSACVKDCGSLR